MLDAAEVVPTFGVDASLFVAHHAGGESAVAHAVEGAEDRESLGRQAAAAVSGGDVAVGLSASGRTPYVAGALRAARAAGALTVLVSSNLSAPLADLADHGLLVDTGPEAIAGSTRLKASTAQKMILNSLSTAVMIRLGRTYSNLMVSLSGTNEKLRQRQIFILMEASGATEAACRAELARCGGDLRLAMLCLLSGLEPEAAAKALAAGGSVRAALALALTEWNPGSTARVTASYQALPGHPADGYPAVSKVLLGQLTDGFPPAAAVRVCTTDSTPVLGGRRLGQAGRPGIPGAGSGRRRHAVRPGLADQGRGDAAARAAAAPARPVEHRRPGGPLAARRAAVTGHYQPVPAARFRAGPAPALLRNLRRAGRDQAGGHGGAGRRGARSGQLQRPGFHAARLGRGGMRGRAAGRPGQP